jgi:hypothetical protein
LTKRSTPGRAALASRAISAGDSCVAVEGSTGTMVILRQGARAMMLAASGSKRMLNSRRGLLTNSRAKSAARLSSTWRGLRLPPM